MKTTKAVMEAVLKHEKEGTASESKKLPTGISSSSIPARKVPLKKEIFFLVPIPPSLNHLYKNVSGYGRVKSEGYKTWEEEAKISIGLQRIKGQCELPCRVTITVTGGKGISETRDIDNFFKAALDFSVAMGFITDDSINYVVETTSRYFPPKDGRKKRPAICTVLIERVQLSDGELSWRKYESPSASGNEEDRIQPPPG